MGGETEAQAAGAGNEPVEAVLRLGDIAAVRQGLEDAVDAGPGDLRLLVDIFEGDGSLAILQQLEYVEGLGENGNQVEPFDLCPGQAVISRRAISIAKLHALKDNAFQAQLFTAECRLAIAIRILRTVPP
jgi:hypothetical protein